MKNKILLVLNILAIVVAAVILIQQAFFAPEPDAKLLVKAGSIFLIYFIAVFRYQKQQKANRFIDDFYKYHWLISGSFPDDTKITKALLKAARFIDNGKHNQALKILEPINGQCKTVKDESAVLLLEALCFMGKGNYRAATVALDTVTKHDPNNANAWAYLSLLYPKFGFGSQAPQTANHAVSLDIKNPIAHTCKALLHFNTEEYEYAINSALNALKLDDKATTAMLVASLSYHELGNKDSALHYIKLFRQNGGNLKKLTKQLSSMKTNGTSR